MLSNIWNHPKTTVAGLLLAILTIGGVLSQQGITLGNAGTGTVVALICAVASALLGLLAKDPSGTASGEAGNPTQRIGVLMLIALLLSGSFMTVSTTGCAPGQVVNEVNVIISEATNILAVAEPNAPWLGELKDAVAALKSAEASWQSGSSVQVMISALNTINAVLAVIPQTAAYAPLIGILVAGIEAVLIAVVPPSKGAVQARAPNPYHGRATVKSVSDSKTQWNAVVDAHPELAVARL